MKYAIIQIGGKQLKVSEGDVFCIENQTSMVNEVLLVVDDEKISIGSPFVEDASVTLSKVRDFMGDKVTVARFKSKSRYHKKKGHRQPLSELKVDEISFKGVDKSKEEISEKKASKLDTKKEKVAKTTKKTVKNPKKEVKK